MALFQIGEPVTVEHMKPWRAGKPIRMRGRVAFYDGRRLLMDRSFSRPGQPYDGLYAVQQQGDHGTIELERGSWVSRRRYLRRNGRLIGELFNVQTPTEYHPGSASYIDLEIDVAYLPEQPEAVMIQDVDDLEAAVSGGHIPPAIAAEARRLAEDLAARLRQWDGESSLDWDLRVDEERLPPEGREFLRRRAAVER